MGWRPCIDMTQQWDSVRLIQVLEEQSAGFVARYQERLHAAKAAA